MHRQHQSKKSKLTKNSFSEPCLFCGDERERNPVEMPLPEVYRKHSFLIIAAALCLGGMHILVLSYTWSVTHKETRAEVSASTQVDDSTAVNSFVVGW
jgi:hypothetical protein